MQVQTIWHQGSEWHDWRRFLLQTACTLTILLLGGAIICWVAANWPGWGRFERLALAQGVMVSVALAGLTLLWVQRTQPAGRRSAPGALLGLACACLGAVLALVGQTYQTGADTSALFISWGILMLPWAVAARSPSVWMLWAVVANVALVLWSRENTMWLSGVGGAGGSLDLDDVTMGMTAVWLAPLNLVLLSLWHLLARGHVAAVKAGPRLLATLALLAATASALWSPEGHLQSLLPWLWTVAAIVLVHRHARPDSAVLALTVLSILALVLRYEWQVLGWDAWEGMFILTIVTTLAAGALGHAWIRRATAGVLPDVSVAPTLTRRAGVLLLFAAAAVWAIIQFNLGYIGATLLGMEGAVLAEPAYDPSGLGADGILTYPGMGLAAAIHLVILSIYVLLGRRWLRKAPPAAHAPYTATEGQTALTEPVGVPVATAPVVDALPPSAAPPVERSMASTVLLTLTSWFAALVLTLLLGFTGLVSLNQSSLILGLLMVGVAAVGLRLSREILLAQSCVALGLVGLLIVYGQTFIGFIDAVPGMWLTIAVSMVLYVAAPQSFMRFLAATVIAAAIATLIWSSRANDVLDALGAVFDLVTYSDRATPPQWTIVTGVLATLGTALFLLDLCLGPAKQLALRPAAWAFAMIATLLAWVSSGVIVTNLGELWDTGRLRPMTLALVAGACLPAVSAAVCLIRHGHALPRLAQIGVPLVLLALAALWLPTPGIAFALTWMVIGFASRQRALLAAGSTALMVYLVAYYYQLGIPLIDKAIWLAFTGLAVGIAGVVLFYARTGRSAPAHVEPASATVSATPRRWRFAAAALGLLAVLGAVNATAWQRENLLAKGQDLLLRLAPVDPRSLMQGDYMTLTFNLGRQIERLRYDGDARASPRQGYAILSRDAAHVGRLVRLQSEPTPRAPDELALHYRWVGGSVKIVTNAFFFAEGQAEQYEQARYGVFKVSEDGQALLTGLRRPEEVPGQDPAERDDPTPAWALDAPEAVAPVPDAPAVDDRATDPLQSNQPTVTTVPPPTLPGAR